MYHKDEDVAVVTGIGGFTFNLAYEVAEAHARLVGDDLPKPSCDPEKEDQCKLVYQVNPDKTTSVTITWQVTGTRKILWVTRGSGL